MVGAREGVEEGRGGMDGDNVRVRERDRGEGGKRERERVGEGRGGSEGEHGREREIDIGIIGGGVEEGERGERIGKWKREGKGEGIM